MDAPRCLGGSVVEDIGHVDIQGGERGQVSLTEAGCSGMAGCGV